MNRRKMALVPPRLVLSALIIMQLSLLQNGIT